MRRSALWAADIEVAAAAAHAEREPSFADRLEAAGFAPHDVAGLEDLLEREAADRAVNLAAGFVRALSERLKFESAAGAALAAVLGCDETLADLASRLEISKQAVAAGAARIRAALPDVRPAAQRPKWRRPERPGNWLTRPEVRARFGLSADKVRRLGLNPERAGTRSFYLEDDVRRRLEALQLEAAAKRAPR